VTPKPARDSYAYLANLALAVPSPLQREAALALAEIDKWRIRDAVDEKIWDEQTCDD
jgi:hypothetical protein